MRSSKRQVTYSRNPTHAARSAHARGDRQFRTYDTSYIQPKRSKVPIVITVVVLVILVIAIAVGLVFLMRGCSAEEEQTIAEGQEITIVVEEGESASSIADTLYDSHLIATTSEFTSRVAELDVADELKPGTYTIVGGTSVDDIIATLQAGPVMGNALTIPEGYRLTEIADAVESVTDGRITADEFLEATSDASVYAADYPFLEEAGSNKLEGFLFPKTYDIGDDATVDDIVRMMLDQYKTETATLDYTYPTEHGLSEYDVLILASIVEKESSDDDEIRAEVASVFYNRLETTGEPSYGLLQSDATTAYEVGHDPTADDVATDSPYNTYTNEGLPPTPICSPGLASLQAVCSPADTDYYFFYFATDDAGELQYSFSETYEEHQESYS